MIRQTNWHTTRLQAHLIREGSGTPQCVGMADGNLTKHLILRAMHLGTNQAGEPEWMLIF